ncbi:MAG: hypothetical protein C0467_28305 [Planctomycetaceae bacterium]|nr:hypothetical protein [Planctomycetaceae bacterium]
MKWLLVRGCGSRAVCMVAFALGSTPAVNGEPPKSVSPALLKPQPKADHIDLAVMKAWTKAAKPVNPALLVLVPQPPAKLDYSSDITFMRCQHPWGGCIGHSFCHTMDVIKEWEHPYTPDVSFPCLWWRNGKGIESMDKGGPTLDISTIAFTKGMCSEARYHTAYDKYTPVKSKDGNDILYWKPEPDAAAQAEANMYHAVYHDPIAIQPPPSGGGLSTSVADLKKLLIRYGPIVAWGNGHCTTIVGYDDTKEQFKYLDNYGDWCYDKGYGYIAYKDLYKEKQGMQYFENSPTNRANTQYAYSARIRIQHFWRGTLTVSIGVGKETPLVVWQTHGRTKAGQHEWSGNLSLDVPLPEYAAKHWPPSASNQWYLKVEDNDRDGLTGSVTEFTLARLHTHPKNHSVGTFHTETFGGPCKVAIPDPASGDHVTITGDNELPPPNPHPGVAQVNVPEAAGLALVSPVLLLTHDIALDQAGCSYTPDHTVTLKGSLTEYSIAKKANVPAVGHTIGLYVLTDNPCVNKPDTWHQMVKVKTDAKGLFSGSFKIAVPATAKAVAAAFVNEKGEVAASSYPMATGLTIPNKPVLYQIVPKKPWQKYSELDLSSIPLRKP